MSGLAAEWTPPPTTVAAEYCVPRNIRVATHFSKGTMSSVLDRTASSSSQAPQQLADAASSAGGRTSRRATHRRGGWITLRFVELSITL